MATRDPDNWCPVQRRQYEMVVQERQKRQQFLMSSIIQAAAALATGDEEVIEKANRDMYARHEFAEAGSIDG